MRPGPGLHLLIMDEEACHDISIGQGHDSTELDTSLKFEKIHLNAKVIWKQVFEIQECIMSCSRSGNWTKHLRLLYVPGVAPAKLLLRSIGQPSGILYMLEQEEHSDETSYLSVSHYWSSSNLPQKAVATTVTAKAVVQVERRIILLFRMFSVFIIKVTIWTLFWHVITHGCRGVGHISGSDEPLGVFTCSEPTKALTSCEQNISTDSSGPSESFLPRGT